MLTVYFLIDIIISENEIDNLYQRGEHIIMKKVLSMAMGAVLAASTVLPAMASEVDAVPSKQKIYINNQPVDVKAFNIEGRNYFMLQDLSSHLNFSVEFDKATNSVKIMPAPMAAQAEKPAMKEEQKPAMKEEKKPEMKEEQKPAVENVTLKDWVGSWNSMTAYLDAKELDEAYEEKAKKESEKKKEKVTAEDVKKSKKELYASDVMGMVITENSIKYYDKKINKAGGEEKFVAEDMYKYVGEHKAKKGSWKQFEATNENPKYKYVMFTIVHGEDMPHFHVRFSNKSLEDLTTQKTVPTFVNFNTTMELMKEEIAE